ncbi:MAG: ABC transporter substrate-binding protein, partial [Pseudomonadota bacterium]
MNRTRSLATGLLLAAALLMQGCGKEEPPKPAPKAEAPPPTVVKIGLAAPITGPQAHIGVDIRNGTQLAVDDINAAGLTIDGKKIKLELVAEDDEANPTKATTVAQKLVDS